MNGSASKRRKVATEAKGENEKAKKPRNFPLSGEAMQRSGGIASMMRLPVQDTTDGLDACFVGVPLDAGTSYKTGSRLAPRHIRLESAVLRQANQSLGAAPFEDMMVADVGDVAVNIYDVNVAAKQVKAAYDVMIANGCVPLTMGGDRTITFPILQAMRDKYGPVCVIDMDAHVDTAKAAMGAAITHTTPFRRAVEENCVDPTRVTQIGLRGTVSNLYDSKWAQEQGFRQVRAKDLWFKSLEPLMAEIREKIGDRPVYLSLCIDAIDPAHAPGTGFPEIGGLTTHQVLQIIHGAAGLNVVGGEIVEVCPPYDPTGVTAVTAATLMFEMLCVLPKVKRGRI